MEETTKFSNWTGGIQQREFFLIQQNSIGIGSRSWDFLCIIGTLKQMRKIGDKCGGWLENEEETVLKNYLQWAKIRVKGPREKIPTFIEVEEKNLVFSVPVWCEELTTYRKKNWR